MSLSGPAAHQHRAAGPHWQQKGQGKRSIGQLSCTLGDLKQTGPAASRPIPVAHRVETGAAALGGGSRHESSHACSHGIRCSGSSHYLQAQQQTGHIVLRSELASKSLDCEGCGPCLGPAPSVVWSDHKPINQWPCTSQITACLIRLLTLWDCGCFLR